MPTVTAQEILIFKTNKFAVSLCSCFACISFYVRYSARVGLG